MTALPELAAVRSLRCLVVDADPGSRARVTAALGRDPGTRVAGAADAYAALRLTQARADWDLVVINLDAPGLNGFELYSRLREASGRDLAVVFLTQRPAGRAISVTVERPAVPLRRWEGEAELGAAIRDALRWAAD